MKKVLYILFTILAVISYSEKAISQITTASMNGVVTDPSKVELPGATVIAIHTPTGAEYGTVTDIHGKYNLMGMKVGGPYKVTFSFIGYKTQEITDVYLALSQNVKLDIELSENIQELTGVTIIAEKDLIDESKTGAITKISNAQIQEMPTLTRSLQDFTRLTPQFSSKSGGLSFAGQNNRFNSVMIDGAVNNDVFGLSSGGTPGDRQGAQPISLDAIDEIQVLIAPFDVRQSGFTGGGVNAVTRGGTNTFSGSLYNFRKNQHLVGGKVGDTEVTIDEFRDLQAGFRLGGPIIKNKLFFFVNAEIGRKNEPNRFQVQDGKFLTNTNYSLTELIQIRNYIKDTLGYDPGDPTENLVFKTNNTKLFARIDYNISKKHKLNIRYNFTDAFKTEIFRSSGSYSFNNSAYNLDFSVNGAVVELQSRLNNKMSN